MVNPISQQLVQITASVIAGAGLGFLYDLLRIFRIRLRAPWVTLMLDLLYWIGVAFALFSLGLGPGNGELRLFMIASSLCGVILYLFSASRFIRYILCRTADFFSAGFAIMTRPIRKFLVFVKKTKNIFKNIFQKAGKWFTITSNDRMLRKKARSAASAGTEDSRYENQKGKYYY